MRHPVATRLTDFVVSIRRVGEAVVGPALSVLGLLMLTVLVMALAPQLVDPVLLALGL